MELYGRYSGRVAAEERRLGTSEEEYSDEEVLLARMDAGLYTMQQVSAHSLAFGYQEEPMAYAAIRRPGSIRRRSMQLATSWAVPLLYPHLTD